MFVDLATKSSPVWPLPSLDGCAPAAVPRTSKVPGIDLAYPTGRGASSHAMPHLTPALAVADGVITFAGNQERGYAVVINHNNGWASYYSGLATLFLQPTMRPRARQEHVVTGAVLGYVGDGALHYELWKLDDERHFEPVGDTLAHMTSWLVLPWNNNRLTPDQAAPLPAAA